MRQDRLKARNATLYCAKPGSREFYHTIRYHKLGSQWRSLLAVMDPYSRRIIGWSVGRQRNQALTQGTLERAVQARCPKPGVIFHTGRGIEYRNYRFRTRLAQHDLVQSMNRWRHNEDNNHMESFFGSLKAERIHGCTFTGERQLRKVIPRLHERFYNGKRRPSGLGYRSPIDYEMLRRKRGVHKSGGRPHVGRAG